MSVSKLTAILMVALGLLASVAPAVAHPRQPDKIRYISPPTGDTPDPFDPTVQVLRLPIDVAVRTTDGLAAELNRPQGLRKTNFFVETTWTIKSGSSVVAVVEASKQIEPPVEEIQLPAANHSDQGHGSDHGHGSDPGHGNDHRTLTFVRAAHELRWDGKRTRSPNVGQTVVSGTYSYKVQTLFIRVTEKKKGVKIKEIDETEEVSGTLTVQTGGTPPPPTLTVSAPVDGLITQASSVGVAGTVSGSIPITVTVNGTAVPVTAGSFSATPAVSEGSNTLTIVATDSGGRTTTVTRTVVRDSVAPAVAAASPASGAFLATVRPQVRFTFSDPVPSSGLAANSVALLLDGIDVTAQATIGATDATFTPAIDLSEGNHTAQATVTDRAGNSSTASVTFFVDAAAPSLTLSPSGGATVASGTPTLSASYADSGSGIDTASVMVTLDGGDVTPSFAVSATGATFTPSLGLTPGNHSWTVRVDDRAGRRTEVTASFVVPTPDTTAPTVSLTPSDGALLATGAVTFRADYSDLGSGINQAQVTAEFDGSTVTALLQVGASQATLTPGAPISDGLHVFTVHVPDNAGNVATASTQVRVDTVAPTLTASVAEGQFLGSSRPTIVLSFSDVAPSSGLTTSTLTVFVDGVDETSHVAVGSTSGSFTPAANLTDGAHSIRATLRDHAGNETVLTVGFGVDTVGPRVSLSTQEGSALADSRPVLRASYSDDAPSSGILLSSYRAFLNDLEITSSFDVGASEATYTIPDGSPLADGPYTLRVELSDRAGNATTAQASFVVDTSPPTISIGLPVSGSTITTTTPEITASFLDLDPTSGLVTGSFHAVLDSQDITSLFVVTVSSARAQLTTALAPGAHIIQVSISDRAGGSGSATSTFQVSPGSAPPVVPDGAGYATGVVTSSVDGRPVPGASVTVVGVSGTVTTDLSGRYSFPLASGDYRVSVFQPGFAGPVQRPVQIVAGRDAAAETILLVPLDTQATAVAASTGGTVTNASGTIRVTFPPGTLSANATFRFTQVAQQESLAGVLPRNAIPGAGFFADHDDVTFSQPVTVAVRNTFGLEPGHRLISTAYNKATGLWEYSGSGHVSPDGTEIVAQVSHFSSQVFH